MVPVPQHSLPVDSSGYPGLSVGPSEGLKYGLDPIRLRVLCGSEPDIWFLGDGGDLGLLLGIHILSGFGNCSDKFVSSGVEAQELLRGWIKDHL